MWAGGPRDSSDPHLRLEFGTEWQHARLEEAHSAIINFRASATIPIMRTRVLPEPNRR